LESGLLLVTGPHKVNGVPLKRVSQAYTLSTSTKIDVSKADVSKVSDKTFAKEKAAKKQPVSEGAQKKEVSADRKALQSSVDKAVMDAIKAKKDPVLKSYLHARFSLGKNDRVHAMKF
jgi:large subunit ribosomal protein L6e